MTESFELQSRMMKLEFAPNDEAYKSQICGLSSSINLSGWNE